VEGVQICLYKGGSTRCKKEEQFMIFHMRNPLEMGAEMGSNHEPGDMNRNI